MKLSAGVVVAAGALIGFAGVTTLGRSAISRASTGSNRWRPPAAGETAPPPCDRRSRLDDLYKRELNLAGRIEGLKAADAIARFLPPRDLPPRFTGPAVRSAVEAAIAGSGLPGRVDEIDCSAFPCLVVGHYAQGDQIGRVQRGLRRNPEYADDIAVVLAMGNDRSGENGTMIGAVVFPRNEPRAAEILAAFRRRRAEVMERRTSGPAAPEPPE